MAITIPSTLRDSVTQQPHGAIWLSRLPNLIDQLAQRWHLSLETPFADDLTGAWVAPCASPSGPSVLKVGFPHFEAEFEIDGLNLIDGECAVRLYRFDKHAHALLMERCIPGTHLRAEDEDVQYEVICALLQELWQIPHDDQIRSLKTMIIRWAKSARNKFSDLTDLKDVVFHGIDTLEALANDRIQPVLLATDLHAGNVLASARRPWLMIDPKPHIGDPCYDLTQHLLNTTSRLDLSLIESLSLEAEVDAERVLRWTFGRLCLDQKNHALAAKLANQL